MNNEDEKKELAANAGTNDLQQKLDNLSEEEGRALETLVLAEEIYDSVIDQLGIGDGDVVYLALVKNMLKRQTKDHLIFAIWNNLDDDQAKHLSDFINQTSTTAPFLDHDEVLMEFAMMYPKLVEQVHESLSEFFKSFIENFRRLEE